MTEQEWLEGSDAEKMVAFIEGRTSERKHRLCACAWARSFVGHAQTAPTPRMEPYLPWLANPEWLTQLAAAELFADRQISKKALWAARLYSGGPYNFFQWVCRACGFSFTGVYHSLRQLQLELGSPSNAEVCSFLHDVFDLLAFRPVSIDPTWRTWNNTTVIHLAQTAYDQRRLPAGTQEPDRLAVLADALEEAGCGDADILEHLRSSAPHARGVLGCGRPTYLGVIVGLSSLRSAAGAGG